MPPTPRVLSVNIAQSTRSIRIRERTLQTGIYKQPVQGSCRVEEHGLVGDRRVEPRKMGESHHAVYAFPVEHYAYWQRQLGGAPMAAGHFGENLTLQGLTEDVVRIGDVLRCGGVTLQIAHPRIPCKKLDQRMGTRFSGAFLRSRRVGYYLRVLQPGHVQAGDGVELLERDDASPTVDDFIRLSQIDYWDAEGLEALLSARDLMPGWQEILQEKLQRARSAAGWFGLRPLELQQRRVEPDGTQILALRCPEGRALPTFEPGQRLTLSLRPSPHESPLRGSFRLVGSTDGPGATRTYLVRLQHDAGAHPDDPLRSLLSKLEPGETVRAEAPRGTGTPLPDGGRPAEPTGAS